MRHLWQITEGRISWHFRNVIEDKEGTKTTLPFINNTKQLANYLTLDEQLKNEIDAASRLYPIKISEYYFSIMDRADPLCPIRRQSIITFANYRIV